MSGAGSRASEFSQVKCAVPGAILRLVRHAGPEFPPDSGTSLAYCLRAFRRMSILSQNKRVAPAALFGVEFKGQAMSQKTRRRRPAKSAKTPEKIIREASESEQLPAPSAAAPTEFSDGVPTRETAEAAPKQQVGPIETPESAEKSDLSENVVAVDPVKNVAPDAALEVPKRLGIKSAPRSKPGATRDVAKLAEREAAQRVEPVVEPEVAKPAEPEVAKPAEPEVAKPAEPEVAMSVKSDSAVEPEVAKPAEPAPTHKFEPEALPEPKQPAEHPVTTQSNRPITDSLDSDWFSEDTEDAGQLVDLPLKAAPTAHLPDESKAVESPAQQASEPAEPRPASEPTAVEPQSKNGASDPPKPRAAVLRSSSPPASATKSHPNFDAAHFATATLQHPAALGGPRTARFRSSSRATRR